jgi:hypothetical protein
MTELTKEQRLASLRRQIEEISALLEEQKHSNDTKTVRILSEDLKELRKQLDELEANKNKTI